MLIYSMAIFFILVLLKVTVWMLFNIELPVFFIALFHLWNHASMLRQLDSHVDYWMVRVVVI